MEIRNPLSNNIVPVSLNCLKVLNISTCCLNRFERNLLIKGPKFCIKPITNPSVLKFDILRFTRNIRFKEFFYNRNTTNIFKTPKSELIEYIPTSSTPPTSKNKYFESLISDIEQLSILLNDDCELLNMNSDQKSLISLKKHNNIFYCKADKGGAIVIVDKNDYDNLVMNHLNDSTTYKKLNSNIDKEIHEKIENFVKFYDPFFKKDEKKYLCDHDFKSSIFYVLPKIHKCDMIKQNIKNVENGYLEIVLPNDLSSRPIVSNNNSPTCRLSHYMDQILKILCPLSTGYIKDTYDFLEKIPKIIETDTIFISLDVTNLYTNITKDYGLEAVSYIFRSSQYDIEDPRLLYPVSFILDGLNLILSNNTFKYKSLNFIQIRGTAMGTKVAPTYANIVMTYFEIQLFNKCKNIYGDEITNKIKNSYFRYLDDLLLLWNKNYGDFKRFIELIESINNDFKFTYTVNESEITFLDVKLNIINERLVTDIYYKETDSMQYLDFYSYHPNHIKRNIPYVLFRRLCRIINDDVLKNIRLNQLEKHLLSLHYPKNLILDAKSKATSLNSCNLSIKNNNNNNNNNNNIIINNNKNNNDNINLIFTYNQFNNTYINNIILPRIKLLNTSYKENIDVHSNTLNIVKCYKQPPNLLTSLQRSTLFKVQKCNKPRCKLCLDLVEYNNCIKIKNISIYINMTCNCQSSNVIYYLVCKKCQEDYVGETSLQLNLRMNLHRDQVRHEKYSKIHASDHFRNCDKGFSIIILYALPEGFYHMRPEMEKYFRYLLKPSLNRSEDFNKH
jgi:hypothetical protein